MTQFLNVLALGTDVQAVEDLTREANGDVRICGGRLCLVQDLLHAWQTPRGSYVPHPSYGTLAIRWLHQPMTPDNLRAFAADLEDTAEDDPRVFEATIIAEPDPAAERIVAYVEVVPIAEIDPFNLVIGYGINRLSLELIRGQ
jgi:hypothetical protein